VPFLIGPPDRQGPEPEHLTPQRVLESRIGGDVDVGIDATQERAEEVQFKALAAVHVRKVAWLNRKRGRLVTV